MLRKIASVLRLTQMLALLLVLGAGTAVVYNIAQFESADRWVQHSHDVLEQVDRAHLAITRSGFLLRNYAIKPDPATLPLIHATTAEARAATDALQAATVDNPSQQLRAQHVASEMAETIGWVLSSTTIGERDGVAALRTILYARVNADGSRALREQLEDMNRSEHALLAERRLVHGERMVKLKRSALAVTVAFVLFTAWSLVYSSKLVRLGEASIETLQTDAEQDPLTGLLNRRALMNRVARLPAAGAVAVIAFDLDDFKPVNDRHGHAAGDLVLQAVATRLRDQCRDHDLLARVGGDEFIVVLPGVQSAELAGQVVARLQAALRVPVKLPHAAVQVDASLGSALRGPDGQAFDDLIAVADGRSYDVKLSRKGPARVTSSDAA